MQTRFLVTIVVVTSLVWINGCASTVTPKAISPVQDFDHKFLPGQQYIVETIRPSDGTKVTYHGAVTHVNEKEIVLDSPREVAIVTQTLGVPIIGKMFKNSSIGQQQLDGPVPVRRDQISSAKARGKGK